MFLQHHVGGAVGEGVGHLVCAEVAITTAATDVVLTFALPLDDASPDAFLRCLKEPTSIQARLHALHVTSRFRVGGEVEHDFPDAGSLVADRSGSGGAGHRVASPEALTGNMGEVAGRLSRHRNSGCHGHAADGVGAGNEGGDRGWRSGSSSVRLFDGSNGVALWSHCFLLGPVAGAGVTARVNAAPVLVTNRRNSLGARSPATNLTSSGVVDAAIALTWVVAQCCECDKQSTTNALRAPVVILVISDIGCVTYIHFSGTQMRHKAGPPSGSRR